MEGKEKKDFKENMFEYYYSVYSIKYLKVI